MRRGQIVPSAFIKQNAKSIEAETTSPKQTFDVTHMVVLLWLKDPTPSRTEICLSLTPMV